MDSEYRDEIGVALFNHSPGDFPVQIGDGIAELLLKETKTIVVQKIIVLSSIVRGSRDFGSWGQKSIDRWI